MGVFCADGWGMKATAAGIYGIRLLLTKRCGRLSPRAVLALDSWPKELPFEQNHRERKGAGKGVDQGAGKGVNKGVDKGSGKGVNKGVDKGSGKGVDKGVEKIVENFVKKWKKMENYSYFCAD